MEKKQTLDEMEYHEEEENDEKNKKKKGVFVSGKRGRFSQPYCQAESCEADLTFAKRYNRRHKVCEIHSKAPLVLIAGLRQRFCQQCSRFHELAEFDDTKRSCRRRLARHNERRRKSSNEGSTSNNRQQNNNNDDDWRKIEINITRNSGHEFLN